MQILVGGRQAGKTHKLIEWLKEDSDRVLICHSYIEAQRIADYHGIPRRQVMSISEWRSRSGRHPSGVAIDNLDLTLPLLLEVQSVEVAALTGTVKNA